MEHLTDLITATFDILAKKQWLKSINRAADKYYSLDHKARKQASVVHALCDRYAELYGEDLRKKEG